MGFFSFLPTEYTGVAELGLVAGIGMIAAFLTSITLLPALLMLLQPQAEEDDVGFHRREPGEGVLIVRRDARVGAIAHEFVPDVALLDIGLPAMDGYELARRLRALAPWRSVRMFAITGYGQDGDRERSTESGFDHHLVKPVNFATLSVKRPTGPACILAARNAAKRIANRRIVPSPSCRITLMCSSCRRYRCWSAAPRGTC